MVKRTTTAESKTKGEVRRVYRRGNQGGTLVTKLWFSIIHKTYDDGSHDPMF
jgi:hypothetical protein